MNYFYLTDISSNKLRDNSIILYSVCVFDYAHDEIL